jgi:PIN domain
LIHVVIDTSIYRSDPKREKAAFRALTRLCWSRLVQLHLPHYVKREFLSQQQSAMNEALNQIRTAAKAITRNSQHDELVKYVTSVIKEAEGVGGRSQAWVTDEFEKWVRGVEAIEYPLAADHAQRVTDQYFAGDPPFRSMKKRDDIPDSFIWQTIVDLSEKYKPLHVIAQDGGVLSAAQKSEGMIGHNKIDDFINLPECQDTLRALMRDENVRNNLTRSTVILREQTKLLEGMVNKDIEKALEGRVVRSHLIPSDDQEAIILVVDDNGEISFDFGRVEFFGSAEVGIQFLMNLNCTLNFRILKSELENLSRSRMRNIVTEDLSRSYLAAVEDYPIAVSGLLSVQLGPESLETISLDDVQIAQVIKDAKSSVEVEDVTVRGLLL